ncbi:MAG: hypothetical protein ACLPYZ_02680 [Limisphaerales bacterium]
MAYKFSLSDAQAQLSFAKVAGVCTTSADFIDYINRAQRRLMRRGNWFDTEWVVSFCVSGCVIAWPRWVGSINGVRFGKGRPGQLFNNNYSFVGPHHRHSGFHCDAVIEDTNLGPTANEVSGTTGKYIRYYPTVPSDVGKTITIFGTQYGGQPLVEQINGVWQQGVTLTIAAPFVSSSMLVTHINAIGRQATDGNCYLYEYDPTANTLRDLAGFEPGETNPRIRRSIIRNRPYNCGNADVNGIFWTTVEALIKLEFIPVVNPRDFLMIDNFDALTYMVQALKEEEAGDKKASEASISMAVREMNFELRDKNADDQIPVRVNSVIGGRIRNPI